MASALDQRTFNVNRDGNVITVSGVLHIANLHKPLAVLHQAVNEAGYQDLILDFSRCESAFGPPMLALCAQVMKLRTAGVESELKLPEKPTLSRLFINTNWAHLIDPINYGESVFKGYTQVPATKFRTDSEQNAAVNRIVSAIMGAVPELGRGDFAAFEWSVNEITDNVLTHAESPIGGLVQVSMFRRSTRQVEYIVADAGVGIPATLRESHKGLSTDVEALEKAIREGITRDKSVGQGNGLFGSYQICSHSGGSFAIDSGWAKLVHGFKGMHVSRCPVPFEGTLVAAKIDFSNSGLLQEALKFDGTVHYPVDFVETTYEAEEGKALVFRLCEEASSFGTRPAGVPVRTKLSNLSRMAAGRRVIVDFDNVPLISSSFADEVFGKLFVELGPMVFMKRFEFFRVGNTVRHLIDRAIMQRMVQR